MVSSTHCPAVHILGSKNVYSRAEGIADHYWPWAVFFWFSLPLHPFLPLPPCASHLLIPPLPPLPPPPYFSFSSFSSSSSIEQTTVEGSPKESSLEEEEMPKIRRRRKCAVFCLLFRKNMKLTLRRKCCCVCGPLCPILMR